MEADGGGWTLVMRENVGGGVIQKNTNEYQTPGGSDAYEALDRQKVLNGKSFKMGDDYINGIRTKHNQGTVVGYRTTTNDFDDVRYFHHEDCYYWHKQNTDSSQHDPCRRYTTKLDAKHEDFVQCTVTPPYNGGIDCSFVSDCGHICIAVPMFMTRPAPRIAHHELRRCWQCNDARLFV